MSLKGHNKAPSRGRSASLGALLMGTLVLLGLLGLDLPGTLSHKGLLGQVSGFGAHQGGSILEPTTGKGAWVGPNPVWAAEPTPAMEQVVLRVEGMECRSCVKAIRKALLHLPGVHKAKVVFRKKGQPGKAIVWAEPGRVSDATLVQTIEAQSNLFYTYKAKVLERELLSRK